MIGQALPEPADQGYTLLEMLLVLSIIALAAAIATPRLSLMERQRFQLDAAGVLADLKTLRDDAILTGVTTTFRLEAQGYVLEPAKLQRLLRSGGAVAITPSRLCDCGRERRIQFLPDGSSTGGAIDLQSAQQHASILVDPVSAHARLDR